MNAALQVRGLNVSIERTQVLRDVALDVPAGRMVGLIGRNGAGKTTLMRSVMRLLASAAECLAVDGTDIRHLAPHLLAARGLGYMPEDRRLIPTLSAEENIMVPVWANGIDDAAARLRRIYEQMPEVADFRDRRAMQLSGGQQKLVALARAFMSGHKLLLLDEPFEGVAPVLRRRLAEVIGGFRQQGLSVILSESDDTHSADLVDQTYRIERGVVTAG